MERAREVFGLSTVGMGGAALAAGIHTSILYAPNIIDYCRTFGEFWFMLALGQFQFHRG